MIKPKFLFSIAAFFLVCLLPFSSASAQNETKQQAETSYEVVLQVLTASNDASGGNLPPALSGVVRKLKAAYPFANYRLTSTYLQRVADTGSLEFKAVTNEANRQPGAPVFSEWTLAQLRNLPDANGRASIQIQNFRFGQRVPVQTASAGGENGKTNSVINYESVGISIQKISLGENTPTVVGSLSAAKPDEFIFLVLTVKAAE